MIKLLASRIKSLRENKGWTQTDLENASGVAQAHISRLETSKTPSVSVAVLSQIADALGTSLDYLTGRTDNPSPSPSTNHPALRDPLFNDLIAAWQLLSELADMGDEAGRKAKTALRLQAQAYKNLAEERLKRKKK